MSIAFVVVVVLLHSEVTMASNMRCRPSLTIILGVICCLLQQQKYTADAFAPYPKTALTYAQSDPCSVMATRPRMSDEDEANEGSNVHTGSSRRKFLSDLVSGTSVLMATTTIMTSAPPTAEAVTSEKALKDTATATELLASSNAAAVDWKGILNKSSKKALGGGKAGAAAAVVQVGSLMWLRTAMNYQYRYGGNLQTSLSALWEQGGIQRLYQGLPFALVQGPLTRFGDTAANVGILALLESFDTTASLPLPLKTACGSIAAGLWRIVVMPVDTSKTAMQVEGSDGLERLWQRVADQGPSPLYQGALASAAATAAGHFPWYLTYNALNDYLPVVVASDDLLLSLARSALLGLCASCVSDCTSNSLRVIKTTKQTAGLAEAQEEEISYQQALSLVLEQDGVLGLLGRGLQTRLLTNMIQGAVFSVVWRYFQQVGIQ